MAEPASRGGRPSAATIALVAAALLAAAAVAAALMRTSGEAGAADPPEANASAGQAGGVDAMIAGLVQRLRQDPDNHEGWFLLGMAYRNSERFAESAQAFRRASELAPQNPDYAAYLGEALLLAGREGAAPPPEAERLFRRALALQPGNAQARYYLATLKDMGGDHRGALDDLLALLREAPANAPWLPQVREAAVAIARQNNIDISARLPAAPGPATATAAIPGPTAEQMAQASAMRPSEQDAMARAMVDRLAARLRQNPADAQGWIQLMRSRMVLRDPRAATEALRAGLAAFPNDAATQGRLRAAARALAVPDPS
ncbi:MAG TPA: tetratricopeptide repeat protein [Allosphingosinicella sp.]|nr:tetratricopeptide repeat protein [Allosphingosinicella sp.]